MPALKCPFCGAETVEVMAADYGAKRWGSPPPTEAQVRSVLAVAGLSDKQIELRLADGLEQFAPVSAHAGLVYVRCSSCTHTWPAPEGVKAPEPVTATVAMTAEPATQEAVI